MISSRKKQSKEKKYWQKVQNSLEKKDGEYVMVNSYNQEIMDEHLEKTLWS